MAKKSKKEGKSAWLQIRISPKELQILKALADLHEGGNLSHWARKRLLQEAFKTQVG